MFGGFNGKYVHTRNAKQSLISGNTLEHPSTPFSPANARKKQKKEGTGRSALKLSALLTGSQEFTGASAWDPFQAKICTSFWKSVRPPPQRHLHQMGGMAMDFSKGELPSTNGWDRT